MDDFYYSINDKEYPVHIEHKPIKNIHYRYKDGFFYISCNRYTSKRSVIKGLDKFGEKLISSDNKEKPYGDGYIYLYGNKINISNSGELKFTNGEIIKYKDIDDLLKKLKKQYLRVVSSRVKHYSIIMKVPEYKVTVRNMSTRYGSNSKKTKSLHFATSLMHYSLEIIDSVIIHELAHIIVYDHSKKFYDVVYKYCPNYDIYRKKLIHGEYK